METIVTFAGSLTAIIFVVMEAVNRTGAIPKNWVAITAIIIGAAIGGGMAFVPEVSGISVPGAIVGGAICGASSSGIHEGMKNITKRQTPTDQTNKTIK
jgi:hypothetical protein